MAFNSENYNDKGQIKKSRPSIFGRLWQKTALRLGFLGASLGFLALQQPDWWLAQPPAIPDSTQDFSGKVSLTTMRATAPNQVRDDAVKAYVASYLGAGKPIAALPEQLSLEFQFHKANLRQVATAQGYDVNLIVAHFEPIAKIFGTPLLLSRDGDIYASNDPKALLALPTIAMPLGERWTERRTLEVTTEQQELLDQAMALMTVLHNAKIRFAALVLKPHRGFQVLTAGGLYLQFGHSNFAKSIKRYQKILTRDDFAVGDVKEIHLDFKGKALITMKPKAKK